MISWFQASAFKWRRLVCRYDEGYVSEDELLSIPELAISPLASRMVQVFQNLNFKDFCRMLAAFSDRASREVGLYKSTSSRPTA
jgi:serine/threonine-protein phosphatase 2B regulatory subunit